MRLRYLPLLILVGLTPGCLTLSGYYKVSGVDPDGNQLVGNWYAQGRGIYSVRNAICSLHENATVIITDLRTGQPLSSESPYKCR